MMREIKFRAYCNKRKEFVRIIDLGLFGTGQIKEVAFTYKDEPYERVSCELPGDVKLIQYTGLKDKNGVEIYEDDIVNFKVFDGLAHISGTTSVYSSEGAFRLNEHHPVADYIKNGKVEVIGNVYEHPHLVSSK